MTLKQIVLAAGLAVTLTGCAGMPDPLGLTSGQADGFNPSEHGAVISSIKGTVTDIQSVSVKTNGNGVTNSMASSAERMANDQVTATAGFGAISSVASSVASRAADLFKSRMNTVPGVQLTLNMGVPGNNNYLTVVQPGDTSDFDVGDRVMVRNYVDGVSYVTAR